MQAAELFEQGATVAEIAQRLQVTRKSVYQWQHAWRERGSVGLLSRGPSGATCQLNDAQVAWLQAALEEGPAAYGWVEDQRWTRDRVAALIGRLFHVSYTGRGVGYLLRRLGWSPQVPRHRAVERDEAAIAVWRQQTWSQVRGWPVTTTPGYVSRTRPASR